MSYNKKLSGAKAVFVPITKQGKNYLPYIEDLRDRYIKYIDFYPAQYLPETADEGLTVTENMYLTLANQKGTELYVKEMPLERYNFQQTSGCRQAVLNKLSLQNSYILCENPDTVGKTAMLVFWYDLPTYSQSNKTDLTITDSLSVELVTAERHNTMPDDQRMDGKRFRRIILGAPTKTPDFDESLSFAQLANIYLTLRKGTYNVVENLPVMLLYQLQMVDKTEFCNIIFDLQNSYLTIGGANTIPDVKTDYVGKHVFFNVVYEK